MKSHQSPPLLIDSSAFTKTRLTLSIEPSCICCLVVMGRVDTDVIKLENQIANCLAIFNKFELRLIKICSSISVFPVYSGN